MQRPPRRPSESLVGGGLLWHALWVGFLIAGLSIFAESYAIANNWQSHQTAVFTVRTFSQLWHVMVIRSETESIFSRRMRVNWPLLGALLAMIVLQLATIYVPLLNALLDTVPLSHWTSLASVCSSRLSHPLRSNSKRHGAAACWRRHPKLTRRCKTFSFPPRTRPQRRNASHCCSAPARRIKDELTGLTSRAGLRLTRRIKYRKRQKRVE